MKLGKMPDPWQEDRSWQEEGAPLGHQGSPPRLAIQLCLTLNGDLKGQGGVPGGEDSNSAGNSSCKATESAPRDWRNTESEWLER